jgi:hypothetical protein
LTDDSTTNATLGAEYINDSIRTICNLQGGKLRFLERTVNLKTIANKEDYSIPNKFRKVIDVYVTVGADSDTNTIYMPEMVFDPTKWKMILAYKFGTNDFPYFTYVENQTLKLQPIPSSNGNTITVRGRLNTIDLSFADYTTGTISSVPYSTTFTAIVAAGATSATLSAAWGLATDTYTIVFSNGEQRQVTLTNGSTAVTWTDSLEAAATATITVNTEEGGSIVTGAATSWTAGMAGRYIKITNTSAANGGDGFWYEIAEILDTTHLALAKEYSGAAISAGTAAYTIGQMSVIPEAYDIAAVYRSVALYWRDKGNDTKSQMFWRLYDGGNEAGLNSEYGGVIGQMLANEGETEEGSYIPPGGGSTIMSAPYYFPYQIASGF